jgi:hypothetical protein
MRGKRCAVGRSERGGLRQSRRTAAAIGHYGELVPAEVATEITDAAAVAARGFASVTGDQWLRKGRRSDGAQFTVETFGRHLVHEAVHHLYDVTGVQHSHR